MTESNRAPPAADAANILLVEDHAPDRVALDALLAPLGQRLVRASSGPEALERLARDEFALVLLDLRVPGLDGLETASQLRASGRRRDLPVIVLTAKPLDASATAAAYARGVVDVMVEPLDPVALRSKVGVFIELHQAREQVQRQAAAEAHARAETELAATLHRVGAVLAGELDLERLVQRLTDEATALCRAEFGAFFYNVAGAEGEAFRLYTLSGAPREAFASFPLPRATPIFAPTFRGEGVVRLDDVRRDPRYGAWGPQPAGHLPVASYLAVPVVSRTGEVLGGLFFGHGQPGVFTARDERLLSAVATQAAVAIDNARLYQRATADRALLEAVVRQLPTGVMIAEAPSGKTILSNDRVAEILGYPPRDVAGVEQYASYAGFHADGRPLRPEEYPLARAIQRGETVTDEEVAVVHGSGRRVALCVSAAPVRAANGQVVAGVVTVQDVTERRSAEAARARHARQASLIADVGVALTASDTLRAMLQRCAEAMVRHLDAAFARVWTLPSNGDVLELQASAGMYTHLDGAHARVPVGRFKIGLIAQERLPHLTNDVPNDPRVGDPAWARREGMVAFAGYPLIVGGRTIGVAALFARAALPDDTLDALASVADAMAVGIESRRAEDERAELQARERAALAAAEHQRQRLETLFFQAPAAICVLRGPEHVFELVNPRYHELVGGRELVGRRLRDAIPEAADVAVPLLDRVYTSGEPFFGNEVVAPIARNGRLEECVFNFIYQPLFDVGGRVEGIAVVAFEVTDLVRARQRVERLSAALAASNQELDQFAYVASHDLKAPLRGIANLSSWIEEDLGEGADAKTREHLRLLRGRVQRLEGLIDGILAYSRAGRVRERPEPVDTARVTRDVVELLAPPAPAVVEVAPDLPVVHAERVPLQQVLLNLVSNALKHARRADARVAVSARDAGAHWEFAVADNGPGIAPEYHDRIWGIFQTLESRDTVESTGIGLSVVKKIVETRGGRAWVESAEGRGATFRFAWPKQPGASS